MNFSNLCIVTGSTNPGLAKSIANKLSVELVTFDTDNWPNNQPRCKREKTKTLNGKVVFIIQSLRYTKVGSPVEELKMIYNGCKDAAEIHLVISWICTKDDVQHSSGHVPASIILIEEIRSLHPKSILVFDLHQSSHSQFFNSVKHKVRHFYLLKLLMEKAMELKIDQVAGTDFTSSGRASKVKAFLEITNPLIFASKEHNHQSFNSLSHQSLYGEALGKNIGIFDDMALSLNTMVGAVEQIKKSNEEADIFAFAVHFDPAPEAFNNLKKAFSNNWLTAFYTTNTTKIDKKFLQLPGFYVIDVGPYIARAIELIVTGRSTGELFLDI